MTVVADANILILFARAGFFHLIASLFDSILITPQVYDEVVVQAAGRPGAEEVKSAEKIIVQTTGRSDLLTALDSYNLGAVDASVIILATEYRPDYLLSDDRRVRKVAEATDLPIMGSGGLLIVAKARGLVSAVKPQLDLLRQNGARIRARTYNDILRLAGE